jgi:hydrogenase nickel incorporation protein HypA/HybF
MHELAIAEGVLEIVEAAARRNDARRVGAIRLEIGALSCVEPAALHFCFDALTRGSIAEGAQLEIDTAAGVAWCMPCSEAVRLAALGDACPRCGGYQLQVTQGDAMRVKSIEIA